MCGIIKGLGDGVINLAFMVLVVIHHFIVCVTCEINGMVLELWAPIT